MMVTRFAFLRLRGAEQRDRVRARLADRCTAWQLFVPHDVDAQKAWDLALMVSGEKTVVVAAASALAQFVDTEPDVIVTKAWTFQAA